MTKHLSLVLLLLSLISTTVLADFTDTLNISSARKTAWMQVNTVEWKLDTVLFAKGLVRINVHVRIGNPTKAPIEINPGSWAIRLARNDKALFLPSLDRGSFKPKTLTIPPKDSVETYVTFVLPDSGMNVELQLTPVGAKKPTSLTFLPSGTTPCKRLAISADLFLLATDVFRKFVDDKRQAYYDESRRLFLMYLKKKVSGPCTVARASDLEDMSGAALRLVNLEPQELNNLKRGDRDAVGPMGFFVSMARMPAVKILKEDSKK